MPFQKSQKLQNSAIDNSQTSKASAQFASRPFGMQKQNTKTQQDYENTAFAEQKMEAAGLELQAKYGKIKPQGQERLTLLQAKMNGLLRSRLHSASMYGHDLRPIAPKPDSAPPIQAKLTIGEAGNEYEQQVDESTPQVVQQKDILTGGVIQCKEVTDLVTLLETKMDNGKLTKAQIIAGLKQLPKSDIDDPNFARALVEFVRARNGTVFNIEDLQENPDPKIGKKHLDRKWTFRHYTTQKYESIQSLAQLEAQGINASKNTNARDWQELGNQGYIFGLIAIDGEVPSRTWLSKMKYYAEYDLKKLDSVWVSGDMLTEEGRQRNSYQGSGDNIVHQLSKMLGFMEQNSANILDGKFKNALEAKVPPASLSNPTWREV